MKNLTRRSLLAVPLAIPLLGQQTDHDQPVMVQNPGVRFTFHWDCFCPADGNKGSNPQSLRQHTHNLNHQIRLTAGTQTQRHLLQPAHRLELMVADANGNVLPLQNGAAAHIVISLQQIPGLRTKKHPDHPQRHPHTNFAWVVDLDRPVTKTIATTPGNGPETFDFPVANSLIASVTLVRPGVPGSFRRQPLTFTKGCVLLELQPNRDKAPNGQPLPMNSLQYSPVESTVQPVCGKA